MQLVVSMLFARYSLAFVSTDQLVCVKPYSGRKFCEYDISSLMPWIVSEALFNDKKVRKREILLMLY